MKQVRVRMKQVRVRIAPSPTGSDLHIGNVRTALFNYLFAKQNGGKFIFRIEDSDLARSKDEYSDSIAETLNWLGLLPDEGYKVGGEFGPYMQTRKLARYKEIIDQFIEKGLAYRCYCSQEELTEQRNLLPEKERRTFRYPGTCRDKKNQPEDKDYVVRLRAPTEGSIEWNDMVFGKMVVPNKENYDWVIMRSNGIPLYNLGCAIDDYDQKITHIIRGRDHTINTNIQIIMHQLLGSQEIKYCHLPMMLGQDGAKLSKRHASVSISEYREAGYTPAAILNYLSRFGWGSGNQEIFSMEDLLAKFSLEACGKNDGKFDSKKFAAIQFEHLKNPLLTPDDEYVERLIPFLQKKGLLDIDPAKIRAALPLIRPRAHTLVEAADEIVPFVSSDEIPLQDYKNVPEKVKQTVQTLLSEFDADHSWSETHLRDLTKNWLAKNELGLKDLGGFMRLSLTGRSHSPELFQVMVALGRQQSLKRLAMGLGHLQALDNPAEQR